MNMGSNRPPDATHRRLWMSALALALIGVGCTAKPRPATLGEARSSIIYGADDRQEVYEATSRATRRVVTRSIAALMPRESVLARADEISIDVESYGTSANLCPGEPFSEQPAAAFCSAVLVDWDLIVTAGHCVHAVPLRDVVAVFGYYYDEPGRLVASAEDVIDLDRVVAEEVDPAGSDPRLDYAVVRLSRGVGPERGPAPVRRPGLTAGQPLIFAGTGGGVPVKIDVGGAVQDARETRFDFFTADTDTSGGSSGGGAFDDELTLVGVMARGGTDLQQTGDGCMAAVHEPSGANAEEEFTYAFRAIEGLCKKADGKMSSLCRSECGDPCEALPRPSALSAGGCSLAAPFDQRHTNEWPWMLVIVAGCAASPRVRPRRTPRAPALPPFFATASPGLRPSRRSLPCARPGPRVGREPR
jgi:hypothetical protein